MSENWENVIYLSHGKYVLMVSDEDDVILSALEHYLKILKENKMWHLSGQNKISICYFIGIKSL